MSLTEIAAIVGALAWIPPIFTAVRTWFTKPQVRVITQPSPEIGYTPFGPILNLRVALTVSHKDIVITAIRLQVTHESGEKMIFHWRGIVQRMGTMTFPSELGAVPFEKELNVLAMKVSLKDVEERFVRFQNQEFLKRKSDLEVIALKKISYLRQESTFDLMPFLRSQEMVDIYSFIRQSFAWKPGVYRLQVIMESPDAFSVVDDKYEFVLSPLHVQDLSDNLKKIEQSYMNEYIPRKDGQEVNPVVWNWVYPEMQLIEG